MEPKDSKGEKIIRKCIRFNPDNYRDRKILEVLDSLPERQQGSFIKNAILATLGEAEVTISQEQSIRAIVEDVLAEKGLLDMRGMEPGRSIVQTGRNAVQEKPETGREKTAGSMWRPDRDEPPEMEFGDEEVNMKVEMDDTDLDDADLLNGLSGFSLSL